MLDGEPTGGVTAALRRAVAALESGGAGPAGPVLSTGVPAIDRVLPRGGLPIGTVHEVGGLSAAGFVLHLLSRGRGRVIWAVPDNRRETLYGPGLQQAGVDPARLAIAACGTQEDLLWVVEEALKSGAAAAVVAQPAKPVDLTASRRLQLAAEAGGALGLILNDPARLRIAAPSAGSGLPGLLAPSAVTTRWQAEPVPSGEGIPEGREKEADCPCWRLRLLRARGAGMRDAGWIVRAGPTGVRVMEVGR